MLELTESIDNPALMAAQLSGLVSRIMNGRNGCAAQCFQLDAFTIAFQEGGVL